MKKFMLLLLSASVLFAVSSCDQPQDSKDSMKKTKHHRDKYREKHEKNRQERRW